MRVPLCWLTTGLLLGAGALAWGQPLQPLPPPDAQKAATTMSFAPRAVL